MGRDHTFTWKLVHSAALSVVAVVKVHTSEYDNWDNGKPDADTNTQVLFARRFNADGAEDVSAAVAVHLPSHEVHYKVNDVDKAVCLEVLHVWTALKMSGDRETATQEVDIFCRRSPFNVSLIQEPGHEHVYRFGVQTYDST